MVKEISAKGKNGVFKGTVEVKMNVRSTVIKTHNHITHDDGEKRVSIHKVIGYHEGRVICESEDIMSQGKIVEHARLVEKTLYNFLNNLATARHQTTNPEEELRKLGFK